MSNTTSYGRPDGRVAVVTGAGSRADGMGNAVRNLVSDEARWVTGVVLPLDAGATAGVAAMPVAPSPRTPSYGA